MKDVANSPDLVDTPFPVSAVPDPGLYLGEVMHARLTRPLSRFRYKVFSLFLDLDRIDDLVARTPLVSRNRFNLVSFFDGDHGPEDGSCLRAHVNRLFAEAGAPVPHTVRLLCFPRILGYAFNPLSIYYGYDDDGHLTGLIYEVRNTFGEMHSYVAPVAPDHWHGATIRQERDKIFFVSPFLGMDMRYHFRVGQPGETLQFRIFETDKAGPVLSATHKARWIPLTSQALLKALVSQQFNAVKVIAGIHWEAGKLWLRGARYHRRGAPPAPASFGDTPR